MLSFINLMTSIRLSQIYVIFIVCFLASAEIIKAEPVEDRPINHRASEIELYRSSGGWSGGGGTGVKCINASGETKSIQVLELYEKLFEFDFIELDYKKNSYENITDLIDKKLVNLSPFFAVALKEGLERTKMSSWMLVDKIKFSNDLGKETSLEKGCERVQFVERFIKVKGTFDDVFPEVVFFKNKQEYLSLDNLSRKKQLQNKMVLQLHETLYYLSSIHGIKNSKNVRQMTMSLLNKKMYTFLDEMNSSKYNIKKLYYKAPDYFAFRHIVDALEFTKVSLLATKIIKPVDEFHKSLIKGASKYMHVFSKYKLREVGPGFYNYLENDTLFGQPLRMARRLTLKELSLTKSHAGVFVNFLREINYEARVLNYSTNEEFFIGACESSHKEFLNYMTELDLYGKNKNTPKQLDRLFYRISDQNMLEMISAGIRFHYCKKFLSDDIGTIDPNSFKSVLVREFFEYVEREYGVEQIDLYAPQKYNERLNNKSEYHNPAYLMFGVPNSMNDLNTLLEKEIKNGKQ